MKHILDKIAMDQIEGRKPLIPAYIVSELIRLYGGTELMKK